MRPLRARPRTYCRRADKKLEPGMAEELIFKDEAAALYDLAFAHVTAYFMPFLLRAGGVAPGMRVLDIATGTGLSAEAALVAVGPTGHVTAADISPAMVAKARERLGDAPNVALSVEDGQALPFPDESFDAVLCNLGLMFFPNPVRGLMEFRRVLRPGGRVAVSVNTVVERSYNHHINVMIARYVPSLAESVTRTFALAEAAKLRSLFDEAGFGDFTTDTVRHAFVLPSSQRPNTELPVDSAKEREARRAVDDAGFRQSDALLRFHGGRPSEERGHPAATAKPKLNKLRAFRLQNSANERQRHS